MGQPEGDDLFRRNLQVFVSREGRSGGTGACADEAANQRPLAATSDSADQRAGSRTSADCNGRALALTFDRHRVAGGLNILRRTPDVDRCQGDSQDSFALELAGRLGFNHRAGYTGAGWDRNFAVHSYCTCQGAGEGVTVMGCFRVKRAAHANHDTGSCGNHQRWRRWRWFRRCCCLLRGRHLLGRSRLLSRRHLLLRGRHLLLAGRHLAASRLVRLGLAGCIGRGRWILALFFLAAGRKTESENCDENERRESRTHKFCFPFPYDAGRLYPGTQYCKKLGSAPGG